MYVFNKLSIALLLLFFLSGLTPYEENAEIQRVLKLRIQRNRYRAQMPPFWPKTIYREPQRPPMPNSRVRFYGGIPRG
jgi:hypothetical protein